MVTRAGATGNGGIGLGNDMLIGGKGPNLLDCGAGEASALLDVLHTRWGWSSDGVADGRVSFTGVL